MRWLAVLAMLLVMPVAAHAPSPLAPATPDTIRVLALGLQHVGWLPPGTPRMDCPQLYDEAGRVRLCTRAEVIDRARWSVANREDVPDGAPVFLPRSEAERVRGRAIIGTLVRADALPVAFEDTLRRAYEDTLVGRASFARTAHERALELAAALVGDAERLHPAVLEPAVEGLVSLGLLPPENAARPSVRQGSRLPRQRPAGAAR